MAKSINWTEDYKNVTDVHVTAAPQLPQTAIEHWLRRIDKSATIDTDYLTPGIELPQAAF